VHFGRGGTASVSLFAVALLAGGNLFVSSGTTAVAAGPRALLPVQAEAVAQAPEYAVGVRYLSFSRGPGRPLPTTVWYPVTPPSDDMSGRRVTKPPVPRTDAPPATGRFPLLLWSHGLGSRPEYQVAVTSWLAASGFVVVGPAYPYTNRAVAHVDRADVPNQALDASYVITRMLDETTDDLAEHIDAGRIAAAGHSAGGTTTNALLAAHRDPRVKAAIVVAGRPMGTFTGPPTPVFFVHGDKDPVVAYDQGRSAYTRVPWPKAFLTLVGCQHGAGLDAAASGHPEVMAAMLDFLHWALDGNTAALRRLPADATLPGVTRFESRGLSAHQ
jgi:predicted esterase